MPSLPTVSQKVIADIEQYLSEWKRMENQTSKSASNIDREVGELTRKLKKKFELADIGKDILRGAGLFGGFEIANKAADAIVERFREAAELSKQIAEYSESSLNSLLAQIREKRTDQQNLNQLLRDQASLQRNLDTASRKTQDINSVNPFTGRLDKITVFSETEGEFKTRVEEMKARAQAMARERQALEKKVNDQRVEDEKKTQDLMLKAGEERVDADKKLEASLEKTYRNVSDAVEQNAEDVEKLAEKYRQLADPTREFKQEIDQVNLLMASHKLSTEEAAAAIDKLNESISKIKERNETKSLEEFFGKDVVDSWGKSEQAAANLASSANELGYAFESAFESAIIEGNKLGDVLQGLLQDLERVWLRKNITDPIVKSLGAGAEAGIMGTIGSLLGFATGGDFTVGGSGGTDSQLVAFKATPGERVSVQTPAQQSSGGGGNSTFVFAPQIAAGVTHQELARVMPAMFNQFADKIDERNRRRR